MLYLLILIQEEAVRFNLEWRVPCTIHFIRRDIMLLTFEIIVFDDVTSDEVYGTWYSPF